MRSFSSTTAVDPSPATNRRQPVRQTRTNPSRGATIVGSQRGLGTSQTAQEGAQDAEIGFFPAITHFTDAISALPKEMVRHYSMLKEVDAKICGPEEAVGQLVATALRTPAPPRRTINAIQDIDTTRSEAETALSTVGTADNISLRSVPSRVEVASTASQEDQANPDRSRRQLFYDLRRWMKEMLPILDEKNHVLSTATDCLDNQLKRCNSSYRCIDDEISEEARYGSLTHWAYTDKAAEKKGTTAGERTRRDAAVANHLAANAPAVHEAEGAALRSELRREAMAARKQRNQHLESDIDDARFASQSTGKRSQGTGKGRKAVDATSSVNGAAVGLGIANGLSTAAPHSKRRKIDKAVAGSTLGGVPMARAMTSVYGSTTGSTRGAGTSPQATPNLENPKKRGRTAALTNGTGRKRASTNTSAANFSSIASSPVVGTFSTTRDVQRRSPAPSLMPRIPSSRGRQNSVQAILPETRTLPLSKTSNKATPSNGNVGIPAGVDKAPGPVVRTCETKPSVKETGPAGDPLVAEDGIREGELRGGLAAGSRAVDKSMKKEELDTPSLKSRPDRPRSISISTRGGKTSKTSTPTQGSFTESQRTRPMRNADPAKRSHKKGAGLAAQLVAAQLATEDDNSSIHGEEEEDDEGDSEPRYCYCNQVSYGEMVGCDMDTCPREWFHLDCVGLTKAPKGNGEFKDQIEKTQRD
ncbi:MAG: hypothetical protein Q9224_001634 [Gallowayella concinna]